MSVTVPVELSYRETVNRLVITAVLCGCAGAPRSAVPSTYGEILTMPPDPGPARHQPGIVRFRQTAITVGPRIPITARGKRSDYELRRAGNTATLARDSYELVGGGWQPIPADHLREQLAVSETAGVMRLTGAAREAPVECHRENPRAHEAASVGSLKCSRADPTDPKATWSGDIQNVAVWSCDVLDSFDYERTWIGIRGPLEFSGDVDLEALTFDCTVSTDAPISDTGLRRIGR